MSYSVRVSSQACIYVYDTLIVGSVAGRYKLPSVTESICYPDSGADCAIVTVCLSVCVPLRKITPKVVDGFGYNFLGGKTTGLGKSIEF